MSTDNIRRLPKHVALRDVPDAVKATISKLTRDPNQPRTGKNTPLPDGRVMAHIANTTIGNIQDARNLFQVLPDMAYAREILISATLSPGDLTETKLIYSLSDKALDSALAGPAIRIVQDFFDESYKIRSLLYPILNDVMFEKGSYPLLILPESSIDRIIHGEPTGTSFESQVNELDGHLHSETVPGGNDVRYVPWGILGDPHSNSHGGLGVSFESVNTSTYTHCVKPKADIKVSLEHLAGTVGKDVSAGKLSVLGEACTLTVKKSLESISVTDNITILKRPMVLEARRKLAVRRIYGGRLHQRASVESRSSDKGSMSLSQVENKFFRTPQYKHIPVQPVNHSRDDASYGHPLVMHLPPESVIPVHVPGCPSQHVGYYVLLDIDGNPINVADQTTYYDDIRNQMNNADSYSSQLMQQARRGFEGFGGINNTIIDEMNRMHSRAVHDDLLARLRNGALSGNYELGNLENISRVMLANHLKGQRTNMLYIPAELMVYIAFDYNQYGVGKSLLEDGKILGSIRASIMLANTLATINNAVGGKTIDIELDPNDEDPVSTVEFLLDQYAKVNAQGFTRLVGSTHPLSVADQIQNHGVNVVVSGNTRYPETKMNVSSRDGTAKPIDSDFEEMMRKRHIQFFGLSPEVMEGIHQTDFATTVVQNNLMLLKRVIMNQEDLEPFLTEFVRRYMMNSQILTDKLRELANNNRSSLPKYKDDSGKALTADEQTERFVTEFVHSINIALPTPETGDIKRQMEAFDDYSAAIDAKLDAYFSSDFFVTETTLGMEDIIDNVKAVVKAEFQRRWLRKHNVLPELEVLATMTEDGESPAFNLMDIAGEHVDGINLSIADYVKKVTKAANKRAKLLQKIAEEKAALQEAKDAAGGTGDDMGGDEGDVDLDAGMDEPLEGDDDQAMDLAGEDDLESGDEGVDDMDSLDTDESEEETSSDEDSVS